jgi:hypothetical protein
VWWVKPIPLTIIVIGVVMMMIYDVVLSVRHDNR